MNSFKKKSILLLLLFIKFTSAVCQKQHRVFIFTDINIDQGDPDDRQSLIHLLWYAEELKIEGVVPDRWIADGFKACKLVHEAYQKDYTTFLERKGFPAPKDILSKIATDKNSAENLLYKAVAEENKPLYVLIWGNMDLFSELLQKRPEISKNIRLVTIGTGLMMEHDIPYLPKSWPKSEPCVQLNWNGFGRNEIYRDSRFNDLWWLEMNWTYAGMFEGEEPKYIYDSLSQFGNLGKHMTEVVNKEKWAQYFRVGDTPSVLYLLDPDHDPDHPEKPSWAGKFHRPFPDSRPNYYTDIAEGMEWNYEDPCSTWNNHEKVQQLAIGTLVKERPKMYKALLQKLRNIYE